MSFLIMEPAAAFSIWKSFSCVENHDWVYRKSGSVHRESVQISLRKVKNRFISIITKIGWSRNEFKFEECAVHPWLSTRTFWKSVFAVHVHSYAGFLIPIKISIVFHDNNLSQSAFHVLCLYCRCFQDWFRILISRFLINVVKVQLPWIG